MEERNYLMTIYGRECGDYLYLTSLASRPRPTSGKPFCPSSACPMPLRLPALLTSAADRLKTLPARLWPTTCSSATSPTSTASWSCAPMRKSRVVASTESPSGSANLVGCTILKAIRPRMKERCLPLRKFGRLAFIS